MVNTPTILKKIILRKLEEIQEGCDKVSLREMKQKALMMSTTPTKGFADALQAKLNDGKSALLRKSKKHRHIKGVLRENFDPVEIAKSYQEHGAAC
ncbi:hypothetical protein THIOSC13_320003 [uncultured Thiomicrorhabdus sp.]